MHTHTREDETSYVLEGAITAYVGSEKIDVEACSYAALPKNVPHGFAVRGEQVGSSSPSSRRAASTIAATRDQPGLIVRADPSVTARC
jgi:quercetin dioxygenase-like cupin family protein